MPKIRPLFCLVHIKKPFISDLLCVLIWHARSVHRVYHTSSHGGREGGGGGGRVREGRWGILAFNNVLVIFTLPVQYGQHIWRSRYLKKVCFLSVWATVRHCQIAFLGFFKWLILILSNRQFKCVLKSLICLNGLWAVRKWYNIRSTMSTTKT